MIGVTMGNKTAAKRGYEQTNGVDATGGATELQQPMAKRANMGGVIRQAMKQAQVNWVKLEISCCGIGYILFICIDGG